MKNVRRGTPVVLVVCLVGWALAWGQANNAQSKHDALKHQFDTMTDQIIAAELKADTDSLEKYLAEDCTIIHGDGKLLTKAEEIEEIRSGARKYEAIEKRESNLRLYANTVVVTTGLVSIKVIVHGKPYSGDIRTTRVWAKREGTWKTVALQVTRVSPGR